jgi:phosphoglycolate phosphatase-like HAD superfamily hydrolase
VIVIRYRVIVFDYDGTLAMSNAIKREAYFRVMPEYGDVLPMVLHKNPADARREIILKTLLMRDPSLASRENVLLSDVEAVAAKYDLIATKGASVCPERSGATACLKLLSESVPLYLLSATQQTSLQRIVDYRGWSGYFQRVIGVEVTKKTDMLQSFALEQNVRTSDVLMVGDSVYDRDAACRADTAYFHMEDASTMQDLICFLKG